MAILVAFAAIGPWRETAITDDWSYALAVKQLIETGSYRPHDWFAANPPFQIWWGSLFWRLDEGFAALRISTLILATIGAASFYRLAREHDLSAPVGAFLLVVLFGNPLVVQLSFSFLTNVPFLSLLLAALFGYTRAIQERSLMLALVASVAAAAAILTRQFGIALIAGLLCVWIASPDRRDRTGLYLAAIALPAAAAAWQVAAGLTAPTWASALRMQQQAAFIAEPGRWIPEIALWRPAIVLVYLGIFVFPVSVSIAASLRFGVASAAIAFYMVAGVAYGALTGEHGALMPYLPIYFNFLNHPAVGTLGKLAVTAAGFAGGIVLATALVARYRVDWPAAPAHQRLLDFVALFLFVLHVGYVQFSEEYYLTLLPFVLIAMGRRTDQYFSRSLAIGTVAALAALVTSSAAIRASLERHEAVWRAGELLRARGIPPAKVWSEDWAWNSYYLFPAYLEEFRDAGDPALPLFERWHPQLHRDAAYLVVTRPEREGPGWTVVATVPFRDALLRPRYAYVLRKAERR